MGGIRSSMNARLISATLLAVFLSCCAALLGLTPAALAQTASTGALTGTVSDTSGGVITGVTVTATNKATGQSRTATTDSSGSYTFSLLPPGDYRASFSASGFKTADVASITVNVTETPVLNERLEVGGQTTVVTVESTAETLQTSNATVGAVVGSQEVVDLPLVSRNYTQIANLSPGVTTNVSNASAIGSGTQDINVNGSRANQNSYSMDGASIVNYVSGTAGQTSGYPGIAIPNPDTIQEFKVQTSQYDAGFGRNPGANVSVVTKTGQNDFHGTAFEFNRNNFFNANDFFYHRTEIANGLPNAPQTLKQNTFGGTLGGHIIKDKLFFFGSYQGFRQDNGIGISGFTSGYSPNVTLLQWSDPSDPGDPRHINGPAFGAGSYRAYLGSIFQGETGLNTGATVAADGSNISNTVLAYLQLPGILKGGYNKGFYVPSALPGCTANLAAGCVTAVSQPTIANEDQYMANSQWNINSRESLSTRYLYSRDPQVQSFSCLFPCNPGAPIDATYINHVASLKLSSIVTNNFVNEARISFIQSGSHSTDPNINLACSLSATAYIIPVINAGQPCTQNTVPNTSNRELYIVPTVDVLGVLSPSGAWGQGGNFANAGLAYTDTYQADDQISWNHGKQTIRAGFNAERLLFKNFLQANGRAEFFFFTVADFLTSSAGPPGTNPMDPNYDDGVPATVVCNSFADPAPYPVGCPATQPGLCFLTQGFCGGGVNGIIGQKGALAHDDWVNYFATFVQDDIKVNRKLTVNLGLRWEYDGFPDDSTGQFDNIWNNRSMTVNTGSFFLGQALCTGPGGTGNAIGTLAGFVVPTNFATKLFGLTGPCGASGVTSTGNKTLLPGSPLHNFGPRIGVAWQPHGERMVVRAGYGMFYDRVYGNLLVENQYWMPPYGPTAFAAPFPTNLENTLHNPFESGAGPLSWGSRFVECGSGAGKVGPGFCSAGVTPLQALSQVFSSSNYGNYRSDSPQMGNRLPLIQEYNLDLQYDFGHGWIADLGYVGSHGAHLYNYDQNINVAHLLAGAPNGPTFKQDKALVSATLPFNDPANPFPIFYNTLGNIDERVTILGFSPGGANETNTNGSSKYNSLQAQLRHQFSHGLLVQASYTWARNVTNVNAASAGGANPGINTPGQVLYGGSNSNNPLDLGQQYGPAAFDRPQRFIVSYVYNLPIRKMEGFAGKAFNGWSISGITTAQNGLPFTVVDGGGGTIFGVSSRAELSDPNPICNSDGVCRSHVSLVTTGSNKCRLGIVIPGCPTVQGWINTAAFSPLRGVAASSPFCIGGIPNPGGGSAAAPCGSSGSTFIGAGTGFGNSQVGSILGPGQWNSDLSIQKNTKITEGTALQFRAEFYNVWNHTQFSSPTSTDITNAAFGKIQATSVTPRVVQFAVKFLF